MISGPIQSLARIGILLLPGMFLLGLEGCEPLLSRPAIIGEYASLNVLTYLYDVDETCDPTSTLLLTTYWDVELELNQQGDQVSGVAYLQDLGPQVPGFAVIVSGTNPTGGQQVYFGGEVCNLVYCVEVYFSGTAEDTNGDGIADILTSDPEDLHILQMDKQGNCTGLLVIPQFAAERTL
jgi:hypothetical protein